MSNASVVLTPVNDDNWSLPTRFWGYNDLLWSKDSILIFLTVGGSVIPMRVLESDSIASVKLRIQTCKGFVVKKQKLVFHGKELARNNSRVKDYGVSDGNVLHLVVRLSDLQAITVRTVCGKEFEFRVQRKRDISYVKKQIAKRGELEGFLDLKDQELVCDGEELEGQRPISPSQAAVRHSPEMPVVSFDFKRWSCWGGFLEQRWVRVRFNKFCRLTSLSRYERCEIMFMLKHEAAQIIRGKFAEMLCSSDVVLYFDEGLD